VAKHAGARTKNIAALEGDESLRLLLDSAAAALYVLDPDGTCTFCNQACVRLLGYSSPADLIGKQAHPLMHHNRAGGRCSAASCLVYRTLCTGEEAHSDEEALWRADGTSFPAEFWSRPLHVGGRPAGAVITFLDISERRWAQDELRASEERLRTMVDNSSDITALIDRDATLLYASRPATRILGYPIDEFVGRNLFDFIHPENQEGCRKKFAGALADAERVTVSEFRCRHKDGSYRHLEVVGVNRFDDPAVGALVANFRDVTARKQAEEATRRHEETLQAVFDHIPVMIAFFDASARPVLVNREWERVLGWTLEEARNIDLFAEVYPDPEYRRQVIEYIQAAERTWSTFKMRVRDGRTVEASWANVRLSDGTGLGIGQDVSERSRLEEKLRQASKMEAVGQLAGGVAHDFNNMLTGILGYCDLLRGRLGAGDPRAAELEEIRKAADRAASLTRQLLAFSRQQVLQPRVLDLNEVVSNMDKMLRRLIGEDIDLNLKLPEDLGHVKADPGQLEQVLLNLVVNARDAMPTGGRLSIETANIDLDEAYGGTHDVVTPGSYVLLAVSDNGVGMDAGTQAHIFEPFFTTKERGKGTGLGLATVYGIVKQSGGYIWVYSEPRQGSVFKIYLPRVPGGAEPAAHPARPEAAVRGSETILLVEDDDTVRDLAREVLQESGYRVLVASHGEEALRLGGSHDGPIHLMLTDVVMPGGSGRVYAEKLGAARPDMKVLYMSGYTDDAIVRHGLLDPHIAFLEKPFTPAALTGKVREVLGG
jgi:PAS domain S-box-containing protein